MIRINGRESNISHLVVKGERRKLREGAALLEAAPPGGEGEGGRYAAPWDGELMPRLEAALDSYGAGIFPGMEDYLRGVSGKGAAERALAALPLGKKCNFRLIDDMARGHVARQAAYNENISRALCALQLELLYLKGAKEASACSAPAVTAVHSGERESEMAEVLLAGGERGFFFLGLPGVEAYERLLEEEKLLGGVCDDRWEAVYYQSHFLPVICMGYREFLQDERAWRVPALVLPHAERFSAALLEFMMRMASLYAFRGEMLVSAADGGGAARSCAARGGGWSSEFIGWLAEKHGFAAEGVTAVRPVMVRVRRA